MSDNTTDLTMATIAERTRAYIWENFLYMRPDWPLGDADPLLEGGVIDSIGVLELVEFLQREFGCTIPEHDITEANVGSIGAIARFVHAASSAEGGGGAIRPHQVA